MFTDLEKVALIIPPTFISVLLSIYLIYGLIKYSPKEACKSMFIANTSCTIIFLTHYYNSELVGIIYGSIYGIFSFCTLLMLWQSNKYSLENISKNLYSKKIPLKLQKLFYLFSDFGFIFLIFLNIFNIYFV